MMAEPLVLERIEQELTAGHEYTFHIAASGFRVADSSEPISVKIYKRGVVIGSLDNVEVGDYFTSQPYESIRVVSEVDQHVEFQIFSGGVGSNRVVGEVAVSNISKELTISDVQSPVRVYSVDPLKVISASPLNVLSAHEQAGMNGHNFGARITNYTSGGLVGYVCLFNLNSEKTILLDAVRIQLVDEVSTSSIKFYISDPNHVFTHVGSTQYGIDISGVPSECILRAGTAASPGSQYISHVLDYKHINSVKNDDAREFVIKSPIKIPIGCSVGVLTYPTGLRFTACFEWREIP